MHSTVGGITTDVTPLSARPAATPVHTTPGGAACALTSAFRMMMAKRSFYR
jgi:hypothetical protein